MFAFRAPRGVHHKDNVGEKSDCRISPPLCRNRASFEWCFWGNVFSLSLPPGGQALTQFIKREVLYPFSELSNPNKNVFFSFMSFFWCTFPSFSIEKFHIFPDNEILNEIDFAPSHIISHKGRLHTRIICSTCCMDS